MVRRVMCRLLPEPFFWWIATNFFLFNLIFLLVKVTLAFLVLCVFFYSHRSYCELYLIFLFSFVFWSLFNFWSKVMFSYRILGSSPIKYTLINDNCFFVNVLHAILNN